MLLNVDGSTKWFDMCVRNAKEIVYITNSRIPFINNETGEETDQNNKPQMLVLFEPKAPYGSLKSSYVSMHEMKEKITPITLKMLAFNFFWGYNTPK